ncbi:MAG: YicC family protein, partial [Planctomycetota bacterium]|nr:YicC family protein [Planctomycetota bacterium]
DMIRSMTGYGAAERADQDVRIAVEIRTVNNRFFKGVQHLPDGLGAIEVTLDKILRETITRGTISLGLTVEPRGGGARVPVNKDILQAYLKDLEDFAGAGAAKGAPYGNALLGFCLSLPGVVGSEDVLLTGLENLPARIVAVVREAVGRLNAMRDTEGQSTADDMRAALTEMERLITAVEARVPFVISEYRDRLRQRVKDLLEGVEISLDDQTLAREVAFAAERSDINEEISRLKSHVSQYRELLVESGPAGRKLEFLTQEMYREVNTIGSKSADSEISRHVVGIKVGVDRLREQSQNVE